MEYEKPFSEDSFSSRSAHTTKTHSYDGVFTSGRSREMSPSMNETFYHEIFRLPGCSIPILDIPELNQMGNHWEILRKSDYSNIFASSMDCAIPLEDLLPHRSNAQENNRRKGKSSSKPRIAFVTQRMETQSNESVDQYFDAAKKLNVPSSSLNDQCSFDENCANMGFNQLEEFNESKRFCDVSFPSSSKVGNNGVGADMGDVVGVDSGSETLSNKVVSGTDSVEPNFRSTESSPHDSFISMLEESDGSCPQTTNNQNSNVNDTRENAFSTNLSEDVKFVSKLPSAAMETCRVDMKGCGTSSVELSEGGTSSDGLRYTGNETSHTDVWLETSSSQMVSEKGRVDPMGKISTRDASESQVTGFSEMFCDEKAEGSAFDNYRIPEVSQDTVISINLGETIPSGNSTCENLPNRGKGLYNFSESRSSEELLDFVDVIAEENYASEQVSSHEMVTGMADAKVLHGSSDMTYEISRNSTSENSSEYHSPAFSDEEQDENSVAAASAAAVRKAIEEAQATINFAKELMVKPKDGRQTTPNKNLVKQCAPAVQSIPFTIEESQCKLSNVFVRSLNFSENEVCNSRNEHKAASSMVHAKDKMGSSVNSQPQAAKNTDASEEVHEVKTNLERTASNETKMPPDIDEQISSVDRDWLVNFGTFQWKFDSSNFKSLHLQQSEGEDAFEDSIVSDSGRAIEVDHVVHEIERRDYHNEDFSVVNSQCSNENCDTSVPAKCDITEPYPETHDEFNEETVEYCDVERSEPLLQNRKVENDDDKLEGKSCEEECRCNEESKDNAEVEVGVSGGDERESCETIKKDDESPSSILVEPHIHSHPAIVTELSKSHEEKSPVVNSDGDNRATVEAEESDWYEETIEGITVTAELMMAGDVSNPNQVGAGFPVPLEDDETGPCIEYDESDEDAETCNVFAETKNDANRGSTERSSHDEDKSQSRNSWFPRDDCKCGIECGEPCLPEESSDNGRKSTNQETFLPSGEEDEERRTRLPEGADEDDYASMLSSDEHVEDDIFVSEDGLVADLAENDTSSRSSDEQWGNHQANPEHSSSVRNAEESGDAPSLNDDTIEHKALEDERVRKTQEEENKLKKKKELEARRQRIVVERAINEARERAFAEAAQQFAAKNVTWKQDEKGERAKSKVEDAANNAKIQSERAAVEKATTAARVRAFEKLLAEMASGKEASGNQSSQNQDLPEGTQSNGSSYWEKLTMEKHQQTAERAAKALAEKNKREQLAKEEQDERHRIAETLDADVKRWARGKERNLRALLSTLQFILGPESGWQPISRNDLVTASAVKKAFIKATLFVHPDKMQQRGATISQKYTCEKVFDLLKEARDRFGKEDS